MSQKKTIAFQEIAGQASRLGLEPRVSSHVGGQWAAEACVTAPSRECRRDGASARVCMKIRIHKLACVSGFGLHGLHTALVRKRHSLQRFLLPRTLW